MIVLTWFVLRVRYNYESSIATAIAGLGEKYRSFCPVRNEIRVVRDRKERIRVPLWTTYVLADWPDDGGISWHRVMDVDGVTGVIGGEFPMPVQESEVSDWVAQVDATGVVTSMDDLLDRIRRGYGRGDRVKIEGGPFDGYSGICNWYDAAGVSINLEGLQGQTVKLYVSSAEMVRVVSNGSSAAPKTKSGTRRTRRRLVMEDRARTKSRKDFVRNYT